MTIRQVGSTRTYTTMAAAIAAAANGDTLEVDAETFTNDNITITQNSLTITGVGATRSLMNCTSNIPNGKAIFLQSGTDLTVENIEFQGAQVVDGNGAAVRSDGAAGTTLRNCYIHHCENGFLAGAGTVLFEYCEFAYNGTDDGQTHNIYISGPTQFTLQYSYSHHCLGGHLVKTRAGTNYILYNRLTDENAPNNNSSYQIDFSNGGACYAIGNSMQKSSASDNSGAFISYGAEGLSNPTKKLYVVNNTFVNDLGSNLGACVFVQTGTTEAWVKNNFMASATTEAFVSGSATEANNVQTTSPVFVGRAFFDYRPTVNTPCIDLGAAPGTGNGVDLTPVYEYYHKANRRTRPAYAPIDCGAFEYGNPVPSWVSAMAVGAWYEIPNTDLADVDPAPQPSGENGPGCKTDCWTSFVVDTVTSTLIQPMQGGHNGYAGNEVDALALNVEAPGWEALTTPTPNASIANADYYADGRPTSRHSNHGVTFDEFNNRVMLFGGNRWQDGFPRVKVDSFNLDDNTYNPAATHPDILAEMASWIQAVGRIHATTLDQYTGDVYICSSNLLYVWRRETNDWEELQTTGAPIAYEAASALDTTRGRILYTNDDDVDRYTILTDTWNSVTLTGANAGDVQVDQLPLFYVPALDLYLARSGSSGGTVYQVNASTFAVTTYSTTGGAGIPAVNGNGPYNKFLYVPAMGGAVYYPRHGQNAWFLKLFDAAAQISGGGERSVLFL